MPRPLPRWFASAVVVWAVGQPAVARATGTLAGRDAAAVRTVVALEGAESTRWTEIATEGGPAGRATLLVAAGAGADVAVTTALVPEALDAASLPTVVPGPASAREAVPEPSPFPRAPAGRALGAPEVWPTRDAARAKLGGLALAPATEAAVDALFAEGLVLVTLDVALPEGPARAPVLRVRDRLGAAVPAQLVGSDARAVPLTLFAIDAGRAAPARAAAIDGAALGFGSCAPESTFAAHRAGLLLSSPAGVLELASRAPFAGPAPTFASIVTARLPAGCALDAPGPGCDEAADARRALAAGGVSAVLTRATVRVPLGARGRGTLLARVDAVGGPERTWPARFDACAPEPRAAAPYVLPGSGGPPPRPAPAPEAASDEDEGGGGEGCGTGGAIAAGALDVLATAVAEGDGSGGSDDGDGSDDDDGDGDGDGWSDDDDDQAWEADDADDAEEARLDGPRRGRTRGAPSPVSRAALVVSALALPLRRLLRRRPGPGARRAG